MTAAANRLALCLLFAVPMYAETRALPAKRDLAELKAVLARSDGATDEKQLTAVLDALRARGRNAASAAETVSALLPHRHPLYRERDKLAVVRLRAYLVATLADIGVPDSALPAILDILAHTDDRLTPLETGAAARAARSLGARGRLFTPYLLEALRIRSRAEEFSLDRYDPDFPASEATTVQLEAIRALVAIGAASDPAVTAELRGIAANQAREDPRAVRAAQRELERTGGAR